MAKIDASAPVSDIGKQALVEIINRSISAVDKAVDFASQQIPEVIEQLLLWKAVSSFMCMILSILIIWAVFAVAKRFSDESGGASWVFAICTSLFVLIVAIPGVFDWLYILIAPKVYLLEYAANLVK